MLEMLDLVPHCGAVTLSCFPPDIPPSAEITILQRVRSWEDTKGAMKHALFTRMLNSAETPLLLRYEGEQWFTVLPPTL